MAKGLFRLGLRSIESLLRVGVSVWFRVYFGLVYNLFRSGCVCLELVRQHRLVPRSNQGNNNNQL